MKAELRMKVEAMAKALKTTFSKYQTKLIAQKIHRSTWHASGCGHQEMARRRRQIERGQLTKSNGLVQP